jgi:hypothetical protein
MTLKTAVPRDRCNKRIEITSEQVSKIALNYFSFYHHKKIERDDLIWSSIVPEIKDALKIKYHVSKFYSLEKFPYMEKAEKDLLAYEVGLKVMEIMESKKTPTSQWDRGTKAGHLLFRQKEQHNEWTAFLGNLNLSAVIRDMAEFPSELFYKRMLPIAPKAAEKILKLTERINSIELPQPKNG